MSLPAPNTPPEDLPLFRGVTTRLRDGLLSKSLVHTLPGGAVLFAQGERLAFQHVVLEGAVHLFGQSADGGEVLIEVSEPPDLVLPAAVLTDAPSLAEARLLEPARLLLIEAGAFRAGVEGDPVLARAVIDGLARQFRRMVRQIKNLKLRTANQRVGCYILELARRQQSERVSLPHEKGLIASELGMTRESFSRALAALQEKGLAGRGDMLTIVDRPRLEGFSRPDPLIDPSDLA